MQAAQSFQNKPTDHETLDSPATRLSHCSQASSHKQSESGRPGFSNILKLQAMFLCLNYHQRAGKTNLFHMRGARFHAGNTWCTFNCITENSILHFFIPLLLKVFKAPGV